MTKPRSREKAKDKEKKTDSEYVPETDEVASSGGESDTSNISRRTRHSAKNTKKERKAASQTATQTTIPDTLAANRSRTQHRHQDEPRSQSRSQTPRNKNSIKSLTLELKRQLNQLLQNKYITDNEDVTTAVEFCKNTTRKIADVNQDIIHSQLLLVTTNTNNEKRIEELQEHLAAATSRIPTTEDITQAILEGIQEHQKALTKTTKEIQAMHKKIQDTQKTIEDTLEKTRQQTRPTTPTEEDTRPSSPPSTSTAPTRKTSYSDVTSNTTNRTLIIKSKKDRTANGTTIWDTLKKTPLSLPTSSIVSLTPKFNNLEILCRTQKEKDVIQAHIQQHPNLRDELTTVTKPTQKQLIILLSIPEHIQEAQILESIATTHKLNKEDTQLRKLNTRNTDHSNWTALLPLTTATQMMSTGIIIGVHRIRVRPFTSVKRCTYCQQYGHSQAQCDNTATCANCGLHHVDPSCAKEPHCINCQISNSRNKTTLDTKHQANSNTCPTYRALYDKERSRLDSLYPQTQQTRPQPQHDTIQPPRQTLPPLNTRHPAASRRQDTAPQEVPTHSENRPVFPRRRNQQFNYNQEYPSENHYHAETQRAWYNGPPPPWFHHPDSYWQPEERHHHSHWQDHPPRRSNWQAGNYSGNNFQPFSPLLPTPFY